MHQPGEHPVDHLFALIGAVPEAAYPDELVPVAGRHIEGVAAFPAGRGLYADCGWDHREPPPFPVGGLMFVGNHLDAEDTYLERLSTGAANGDPCPGARRMHFWSMLYALLDAADIPRHQIFVTNVHPALVAGSNPRRNIKAPSQWLEICEDLLRVQMETMQPSGVVAMGRAAQNFVSERFHVPWSRVPQSIRRHVADQETSFVAIRHPSASQSLDGRRETAAVLADAYGGGPC